jgi:CBS domain-containing protein
MGIVTDRDLRKVVAIGGDFSYEGAVKNVMSSTAAHHTQPYDLF